MNAGQIESSRIQHMMRDLCWVLMSIYPAQSYKSIHVINISIEPARILVTRQPFDLPLVPRAFIFRAVTVIEHRRSNITRHGHSRRHRNIFAFKITSMYWRWFSVIADHTRQCNNFLVHRFKVTRYVNRMKPIHLASAPSRDALPTLRA
jgi:hypothetical protein